MKLICAHADTCLPDYWGGHHLPHVAVPVYATEGAACFDLYAAKDESRAIEGEQQ